MWKNRLALFAILFLITSLITVPFSSSPIFADNYVIHQESIDVKMEFVEKTFMDIKNYPNLFSDEIKSVQEINKDGRKIVRVEMDLEGYSLDSDIEYKKVNGKHVVYFLSGTLKGTTLTTTLSKTWSFDDIPDAGTLVHMELDLKLQSFLLDLFVSDGMALYGLDKGLLKLEEQAKKLQASAEQLEKQTQQTKSTTTTPQVPSTTKTTETKSTTTTPQVPSTTKTTETKSTTTTQVQPKQQTEVPIFRGPPIQQAPLAPELTLLRLSQEEVSVQKYKIRETTVAGKIVNKEKDKPVFLTLIGPDGSYSEWTTLVASSGNFGTKILLDYNSPEGTYKVKAKYEQSESEPITFNVIKIPFDPTKINLPKWIKTNAKWWAEGLINDSDFVPALQYLIKERIIIISETKSGANTSTEIPEWVKNNAKWWSYGMIDDFEFIKNIEYLVEQGIIKI